MCQTLRSWVLVCGCRLRFWSSPRKARFWQAVPPWALAGPKRPETQRGSLPSRSKKVTGRWSIIRYVLLVHQPVQMPGTWESRNAKGKRRTREVGRKTAPLLYKLCLLFRWGKKTATQGRLTRQKCRRRARGGRGLGVQGMTDGTSEQRVMPLAMRSKMCHTLDARDVASGGQGGTPKVVLPEGNFERGRAWSDSHVRPHTKGMSG